MRVDSAEGRLPVRKKVAVTKPTIASARTAAKTYFLLFMETLQKFGLTTTATACSQLARSEQDLLQSVSDDGSLRRQAAHP